MPPSRVKKGKSRVDQYFNPILVNLWVDLSLTSCGLVWIMWRFVAFNCMTSWQRRKRLVSIILSQGGRSCFHAWTETSAVYCSDIYLMTGQTWPMLSRIWKGFIDDTMYSSGSNVSLGILQLSLSCQPPCVLEKPLLIHPQSKTSEIVLRKCYEIDFYWINWYDFIHIDTPHVGKINNKPQLLGPQSQKK